ncbi:secretory subunit [Marasmius sp. AFHP31]|nr:secretory subunit [Marasmius sp. AFHP31]
MPRFKRTTSTTLLLRLSRRVTVELKMRRRRSIDWFVVIYKVNGERVIVPSSIVYLVVKLRITPPNHKSNDKPELTVDQVKKTIKAKDEKDSESVLEKTVDEANVAGYAHAPYWPGVRTHSPSTSEVSLTLSFNWNRRPGWWLLLADDKSSRVVVPPMKITHVPYANSGAPSERDYRVIQDSNSKHRTDLGGIEDGDGQSSMPLFTSICSPPSRLQLKIDDASALETQDAPEDEISDLKEDSLR